MTVAKDENRHLSPRPCKYLIADWLFRLGSRLNKAFCLIQTVEHFKARELSELIAVALKRGVANHGDYVARTREGYDHIREILRRKRAQNT